MTLLVQTDRIISNFKALQKIAGSTPIIPHLEANANGIGDVAVARILADLGIRTIAVSRLDEAVRIAQSVSGMDILLMTPYSSEEDIKTILDNDLIAAVGSDDAAILLSSLSKSLSRRARIQLCFDFGMGHFGYLVPDATKAAKTVKHLGNLELFGVFTAFPSKAEKSKKKTEEYVKIFNRVISTVEREGIPVGVSHMATINQFIRNDNMRFGALRVSDDMFGRGPLKEKHGLRKVGRVISEICDLKWLTQGNTVGDKANYKIKKATRVAIVPAGKADGIRFRDRKFLFFKKKHYCEIAGKRARIIGDIGLSTLTVDTTELECSARDIVSFDVDPVKINSLVKREYV